MAFQRRNSTASEENMSQGSSFRVPGQQLSRFHLGPSGLPLMKCPRCGSPAVECKSWRQGGRVFFKCEKNEQYVLEACTFFKWYDSYQRMLEGMELDITEEEVPVPIARAAGGEGDMVDEGKIDKLTKWIRLLVLMNIVQGLLVLFDLLLGSGTMAGWDLAPGFSVFFLGEDLVGVPATGAVFLGDLLAGLTG
uniref:Zinc finger GRF-type domain-containing protein n=1 Tax=Oryza meridionalis TaxID=40149 RepID=A0A0E0DB44_9ORYZ